MKVVKSLLLLCTLTAFSQTLYAGPGKRIMNKVTQVVELLEDRDETIASVMVDQLSESSDSRSYTRTLYKGNTYTAIASGDSHFSDIDMTVYRKSSSGNWIEVGKDADSSNTAVVGFDCNTTGQYKFEVKAFSFSNGSTNGYYGFVLSYE